MTPNPLDPTPERHQETTEALAPPTAPRSRSERRPFLCRFAMADACSQAASEEMGRLLRGRLRIAALIVACGFSIFFVRSLLDPNHPFQLRWIDLVWQGTASGIFLTLTALLWSRVRLTYRCLRNVELLLFGVHAAYFAWIQYAIAMHLPFIEELGPRRPEAVVRMVNMGNVLRWFVLIVIYGVFVPNTWRRCALFVGILATIPLVLLVATAWLQPLQWASLDQTLPDMLILLSVAAAVAIFGSYRIGTLEEEASAARQLGQYVLRKELGEGGMGKVYLGEHLLLRRACAVKLIRPDHLDDPTCLPRFEREVRAMATLTHPNAVEVYDYGHTPDGTFYYVMEYLPGLSLQELVDRHGPLSPARAVHFLRQVCGALQEAHGIGLIHRDIKPSNIIVCERGGIHDVAKLLDFGLVQNRSLKMSDPRLTTVGVVLGSPPYMSPEQALGRTNLDARADIYSLGGVAFFLLTGQPPFDRETATEMLLAHVHEPVPSITATRPDVPPELEAIIVRCLSKLPKDRYPDVESLDEALTQCPGVAEWSRKEAAVWWGNVGRQETRVEEQVTVAG